MLYSLRLPRWARSRASRRSRRVYCRLTVEELENRMAPSASSLMAAANLDVQPLASAGSSVVYTPQQIKHAYGFDNIVSLDGTGQTIAVVDAYDAPNVASDAQTFSDQFGLGTVSLTKTSPTGAIPKADSGWAGEITLDVEWAHAIAPKANILLVEAVSNSLDDLMSAVDTARNTAGVSVVSISWGGSEFAGETAYDSHLTTPVGHTGITFVASSGDSGAFHGLAWPSASPNVLSVGGTTLKLTSSGDYGSESGWSGSGGGYSKYESEPTYQTSAQSSGVRTDPDVAYNANPKDGVYVYFTPPSSTGGWYSFGGTSAGAPQWSGLIALANQGRGAAGSLTNAQAAVYSLPSTDFHDVTSGSNGFRAHTGYDLVTGRGTPKANFVVQGLISATATSTVKASTTSTTTTTSKSPGAATVKAVGTVTAADDTNQILLLNSGSAAFTPSHVFLDSARLPFPNAASTTTAPLSAAGSSMFDTSQPFLSLFSRGQNDAAGLLDDAVLDPTILGALIDAPTPDAPPAEDGD